LLTYGLNEDGCLLGCCAVMKEAVSTSETSVNFYQTERHSIPEFSHLHTRCRENLKFHLRFTWRWLSSGMLRLDEGGSKHLWNVGKRLPD
jgi:hypothetical protein